MRTKVNYLIKSIEEDKALRALAEALGWKRRMRSSFRDWSNYPVIQLDIPSRVFCYWVKYPTVDIGDRVLLPELVSELERVRPPVITIGEHTVEFKAHGIQVGCTFVPTNVVNAIAKELNENLYLS